MKVQEYRVHNHGVHSPDYFQGHGVSFTDYVTCATGCGNTYWEAFLDALDGLAQQEYDDVDNLEAKHRAEILADGVWKGAQQDLVLEEWQDAARENGVDPSDEEVFDKFIEENSGYESYYYVSVDVK